jgi:hypothetical protein
MELRIEILLQDFYRENHWTTLRPSWQHFLQNIEPSELGLWLLTGKTSPGKVWPLGIQAFRKTIGTLSLQRKEVEIEECLKMLGLPIEKVDSDVNDPRFEDLFKRHVKHKKRHEVVRLGKVKGIRQSLKILAVLYSYSCLKVISSCALECNTRNVLDIGSGLGHLSRYLTYNHGMDLTCVDSAETFTASAK